MSKKNITGILIAASWCVILTLSIFFLARYVNEVFYERWPLVGDTASYWLRDLSILDASPSGNRLGQILNSAMSNPRDPLRTLAYAFVGSSQILSINGHLYFSTFCAFLFFLSMTFAIWTRTLSIWYSLAATGVALLCWNFWDPVYGFPSKLPDMPASLLFGSSLAMLFVRQARGDYLKFFASGALLGLATLSRYHVWMYGSLIIAPIVTILAVEKARASPLRLKNFVLPHCAFIFGLALTGGYFIVTSLYFVLKFYTAAGYGLNQTLVAALSTTGRKLVVYSFGVPAVLVLLLISSVHFSILWRNRQPRDIADHVAVVWAALACPFVIIVFLRVEDDVSQTFYMVPGLLLALLTPFRVRLTSGGSIIQSMFSTFSLSTLVIVPMAVCFNFYVRINSEEFLYPRPQIQRIALFNKDIADTVAKFLPASSAEVPVIDSNIDYYARYIIPLVQLHNGHRLRFANIFQIRQSQWELKSKLPNPNGDATKFTGVLETDKELIMPALVRDVDFLVLLKDVDSPAAADLLKDDYTREMARFVDAEVEGDKESWVLRGVVGSPYGSDALVYENVTRHAQGAWRKDGFDGAAN
ncbi:hypothetical protein [Rhizobium leguminosarum]|uniref:hypothetical protein n=1 Tax=Rhizobium leguminosarum TaxID=384 RepID=UPI0024B347C1|nr:hypothetical protein [Rhizobium leguminosarum]WHO78289.1 hypothetical protein QMO81_000942 [Rhizobium leguminosarum]